MFNSKIIKKKEMSEKEMPEEYGKKLHIGKKAFNHALASMAPEGQMEDEKEDMEEENKKIVPQSKIEIELMINGAKKKKK